MRDALVTLNAGLAAHRGLVVLLARGAVLCVHVHRVICMATLALPGVVGLHPVPDPAGHLPTVRFELLGRVDGPHQLAPYVARRDQLGAELGPERLRHVAVGAAGANS